jgi:hypothetical protein
MKCELCEREVNEKKFCLFHELAYEEIRKGYLLWIEALDIDWKEYLSEIEKNSLTGSWAKEVIDFIRES